MNKKKWLPTQMNEKSHVSRITHWGLGMCKFLIP